MESVASNTWRIPYELALAEFFLTILQYEYRGFNLDIQIELAPVSNVNIYRMYITWRSPTNYNLYHLIYRSRNEFVVRSIVASLAV